MNRTSVHQGITVELNDSGLTGFSTGAAGALASSSLVLAAAAARAIVDLGFDPRFCHAASGSAKPQQVLRCITVAHNRSTG